jgi:4-hydroxy-3-methylbut-2-enyl diphosphate reductase
VKALSLVAPRGYCAGVERAIETVERVLDAQGAPVYVRGEIVHNQHVVATLRERGAVFVESVDEVPEDQTIILSAHGSAPEVYRRCEERRLRVIDATCPLVSKVHAEVRRYARDGATVLLVGHADHDEVIGTRGEAAEEVIVVEDVEAAERLEVPDPERVALTTQTTLSLDDTRDIVEVLKRRFPKLARPAKDDICYATQNRQDAVKAMAPFVDLLLVLGAPNSSNSLRLCEVARDQGVPSHLIERAEDIRPDWLEGVRVLGLTASASAPEILVQEVVRHAQERLGVRQVEEFETVKENVSFSLPQELKMLLKPASPEAV